jgi:hypothetical protein
VAGQAGAVPSLPVTTGLFLQMVSMVIFDLSQRWHKTSHNIALEAHMVQSTFYSLLACGILKIT